MSTARGTFGPADATVTSWSSVGSSTTQWNYADTSIPSSPGSSRHTPFLMRDGPAFATPAPCMSPSQFAPSAAAHRPLWVSTADRERSRDLDRSPKAEGVPEPAGVAASRKMRVPSLSASCDDRGMTADGVSESPVFKDKPEEAAYDVVPRLLGGGVTAEFNDHSGRQGVVDFLLHYPDGRSAAMEVTSAAGEGMRQLYALLAEHETLPNPGSWTWSASIGHPRDLPELVARCSRIVEYCEAHGIEWPQYAYEHRGNPDIAWLLTSTASLHGSPDLPKWDAEKNRERPLFLTQGGRGGTVNESLSKFADAMNEVVAQDHVQKRVAKLDRSSFDEQHLFLVVDDSAVPFDVHYALMRGEVTPPVAPKLPGNVTHLWLLITFTPKVLLITAGGLQVFDRDK